MKNNLKILLFVFPLLTLVGLAIASVIVGTPIIKLVTFPRLGGATWFLLAAGSLFVYLTDAWRFRVCGAILGIRLRWATCIEASIINLVFGWVTPGGALGAPSGGAVLHFRDAISWEDSMIIAFGKSISGITFLLISAVLVILAGFGPDMGRRSILYPLVGGILAYGIVIIFCLAGALKPRFFIKPLERMKAKTSNRFILSSLNFFEHTVEKFQLFQKGGSAHLIALFISNFFYFASFTLVATWVAYAMGARPFIQTLGISVVKVAATFVAPTPGGAGFSEATAEAFYGGVLPGAAAVSAVLFFRLFTFYTQVGIGLIYYFFFVGTAFKSSAVVKRKA